MVNLLVTQTIFLLTCFIMHVGGLKTGIKTVSKQAQFGIRGIKHFAFLLGVQGKKGLRQPALRHRLPIYFT
jgi:hypothetical protein